jgi:hypothetical protein
LGAASQVLDLHLRPKWVRALANADLQVAASDQSRSTPVPRKNRATFANDHWPKRRAGGLLFNDYKRHPQNRMRFLRRGEVAGLKCLCLQRNSSKRIHYGEPHLPALKKKDSQSTSHLKLLILWLEAMLGYAGIGLRRNPAMIDPRVVFQSESNTNKRSSHLRKAH